MKNVIEFKNRYMRDAIVAAANSPIFPETIISAGGLESGYGKSELAAKYNNFFGIKWNAKLHAGLPFISMRTREEDASGKTYYVNAKFVHFNTPADSFRYYVKFVTGPRYVKAGVTVARTPEEQFAALKKAGYATDTAYVSKLTSVLKMYGGYFSDMAKGVANEIKNNPGTSIGVIALGIGFFF